MDERELLTRFKDGTLDRDQAARLLAAARAPAAGTDLVRRPPGPYAEPPGLYPEPAAAYPYPEPGTVPPPEGSVAGPVVDDRYAVVGLAGHYPLAPDLHAYWENVRTGRDTSSAVPVDRPGLSPAAPGRRGHFLDGVAAFDPEFFGIAPAEAALIDPQERLFLEVAWEALEDAGCTGPRLDALTTADGERRAVGVFVGVSSHDYALLAAEAWAAGARGTPPDGGHWGLPGRLAALLELTGPAQAVDTAECSALTAVHLAVGALRRGECAAAVAGGVELLLHPSRVRDGAGEGVGAVVLKPLHAALADGDRVHALIRDTASGRGAPRGNRPGAAAAGTGEHETRGTTARRIGSAGAVTGIAALTAAVLRVRHEAPAPGDGEDTQTPWPRSDDGTGRRLPRTATVEIDTDGGCRARAVVEEYEAPEPVAGQDAREEDTRGDDGPFLLSAPTPGHLAATARRLADWLSATVDGGHPADGRSLLAGVARALRTGRAAMPCRLAVRAPDVPRLVAVLRRHADTAAGGDEADTADLRAGGADPLGLNDVPETRDYLAALWRAGRHEQLTRLWLGGVDVDWVALEAASPHGAPAEPPPSVLLRRPLWLDRAPADGARTEQAP
ncbi:beta-ketoacyl synthase N-terminal-like domain-containing protein [Streptomyces sp. NPDC006285]|uniref:beta-ketoacyl synthase N-terminal-like domain-containing protein n=1 Tax=Streptomyces sp. NPDC006285 TaxID=3364742 RepID=UPI0036B2C347